MLHNNLKNALALPFKMSFNLFQRFAFGLRQEECSNDKVENREASEQKEDRGVAMFADER